MKIEIDVKSNPSLAGEILRDKFFKEKYGCYSCFDFSDGVVALPSIKEGEDLVWQRALLTYNENLIEMRYSWDDGDGRFMFIFNDGNGLYNPDCKKSNWEFVENLKSLLNCKDS